MEAQLLTRFLITWHWGCWIFSNLYIMQTAFCQLRKQEVSASKGMLIKPKPDLTIQGLPKAMLTSAAQHLERTNEILSKYCRSGSQRTAQVKHKKDFQLTEKVTNVLRSIMTDKKNKAGHLLLTIESPASFLESCEIWRKITIWRKKSLYMKEHIKSATYYIEFFTFSS